MKYDLSCRYDTRKSFYGKAQVEMLINNNSKQFCLYSYGTLVAMITEDCLNKHIRYDYYGKYSCTTTRHQKEFFKQNGLCDKEIKELFKNGKLIKEC